jgi:hypothetical protein
MGWFRSLATALLMYATGLTPGILSASGDGQPSPEPADGRWLRLEPSQTAPGETTVLRGGRWAPGSRLYARIFEWSPTSDYLHDRPLTGQQFPVEDDGTFAYPVRIPTTLQGPSPRGQLDRYLIPGDYGILVSDNAQTEIARFTVGAMPGVGMLWGQTFLDLNGDGVLGGLEQPSQRVELTVSVQAEGQPVVELVTDVDGMFVVPVLPPGCYVVAFEYDKPDWITLPTMVRGCVGEDETVRVDLPVRIRPEFSEERHRYPLR